MVEPRAGIEVESGADIFNEADFRTIRKDERYITDWICESIESEGYRVIPLVIPACGVGAPHERGRVWFIANAADARFEGMQKRKDGADRYGLTANSLRNGWAAERARGDGQKQDKGKRGEVDVNFGRFGEESPIADPYRTTDGYPQERYASFPTQSPICGGNDGISARLHNIAFSKWRGQSLKAYGNSMCVDVVYEIFRAIDRVNTIVNVLYNNGG